MTYKISVYSHWVRNTLPAFFQGGDDESHMRSMTFIWGGGRDTHGDSTSDPSFVSGGRCNNVGTPGGCGAPFSSIGGGQGNCIDDSLAAVSHSSIFGGIGNCIADSCSSILGGAGNTIPVGFPNSHIVGSGIVLNPGIVGNPNSLHINGLWAGNLPLKSAGAPIGLVPGSVWVDDITAFPNCILMIS